jgi:cyanophycinase-like exopeptidase
MASFSLSQAYRGDTIPLSIAVTREGTAVDLTGAALRFVAKRRLKDADVDALITKTIGAGITVTDAAAGAAVIMIDPADTDGFLKGMTLQCEVQMVESDGTITTVAQGTLEVKIDAVRTVP